MPSRRFPLLAGRAGLRWHVSFRPRLEQQIKQAIKPRIREITNDLRELLNIFSVQ